jgi:hypothetical protein
MKSPGLLFCYLLLGFPLFYFVYKFGNPEPIAHDYFQYCRLYKDLDIGNVNAPFNMRLLGAFFVYLLYHKVNLFYETQTAFDYWTQFGFLKQVFFCAVFFNYLCVCATCVVIHKISRLFAGQLLSFASGMLYLLGFGTIFYCLMPLTEACAILLFAVFLFFYTKKSRWAHLVIALLIFQREYLLLVIALMALLDSVRLRERYYARVLGTAVVAFIAYFTLRQTCFYTPALEFQISPADSVRRLFHWNFPAAEYVRQTLLTMNIAVIYLGILVWKKLKVLSIDGHQLLHVSLQFVMVNIGSIAGGHGNNNGRYFYLVVPLLIVYCLKEIGPILSPESRGEKVIS